MDNSYIYPYDKMERVSKRLAPTGIEALFIINNVMPRIINSLFFSSYY